MQASARLMRSIAAGSRIATKSDAVLAEVVYVLEGPRYHLGRKDIADGLLRFFLMKGMTSPHKTAWMHSVEIWLADTKLSFGDSLVAAISRESGYEVATFDRRLARVEGLSILDPES